MELQTRLLREFDTELKFRKRTIQCLSPRSLKNTYPNGGCKVRGEVTGKKLKNPLGTVRVGSEIYHVAPCGKHSSLFWRTAGYLAVGEDEYIALKKSRLLFLLLLLGLVAALAVLGIFLLKPSAPGTPGGQGGPVVIQPDHPLPPVDDNSQKLEDDNSQKAEVADGGGSVSMIYTLEAALDLSEKTIGIYFKNPNASSHNVTVDFYIVSGGVEYLVAQSGLLEAGYGLTQMTLLPGAPSLSEGIYTGLYRLHCYDPESGEQAMVVPTIAGVSVTVTN